MRPSVDEHPLLSDKRILYPAIFIVWTLLAWFLIRQAYLYYAEEGRSLNLGGLLSFHLSYVYLWALLTPLTLKLARNHPIFDPFRWRGLLLHLVAGVAVVALHGLAAAFVISTNYVLFLSEDTAFLPIFKGMAVRFGAGIPGGLIYYWVIVGVYQIIHFYHRYRVNTSRLYTLETQLESAKIQTLKMQLHPHFLFNSLNTVSSLIRIDMEKADLMLARLSEFLRMTLEKANDQWVTLEEEMRFVRAYLDVEAIRFQRLAIGTEIGQGLEKVPVPFLILLPLVENAVIHGIARYAVKGRIDVRARAEDDQLIIVIHEDCPGSEGPPVEIEPGIGLTNVQERLRLLCGDKAELRYVVHQTGWHEFQVRLPMTGPRSGDLP